MGRSVFVSCFVKTARVQLRHSRIGFVRAEGERIPIHLNCPTHRRRSSSVVRHSSSQVATVLSPLLAVLILYLAQLSLYKTTHLDRYKCVVVAGESPRLDPGLSAHPAAHSFVRSFRACQVWVRVCPLRGGGYVSGARAARGDRVGAAALRGVR